MGSSNSHRLAECVGASDVLSQVETITERVDSELVTIDPGRNATVLAHNDFADDGPGVQQAFSGVGQSFKSST